MKSLLPIISAIFFLTSCASNTSKNAASATDSATSSKSIDFSTAKKTIERWIDENGKNYGVLGSGNNIEAHILITQEKCQQYAQEIMSGQKSESSCTECLGVYFDSSNIFYLDADGDLKEDALVQTVTDICQPHSGFSDTEPLIFLLLNNGSATPKLLKMAVAVDDEEILERDHDASLRREFTHVQFVRVEGNNIIGTIRYKDIDACDGCPWDLRYEIAFKVMGSVLASQKIVKTDKNPDGQWKGAVQVRAGNSSSGSVVSDSQMTHPSNAMATAPQNNQVNIQLLSFEEKIKQLYDGWNKEENEIERRNGRPSEFLYCYNRYYILFSALLGELNTFEEHQQFDGSQKSALLILHGRLNNAINLLTEKQSLEKNRADFERSR